MFSGLGVKHRLLYEYKVNRDTYKSRKIYFTKIKCTTNRRVSEFEEKYALNRIVDLF